MPRSSRSFTALAAFGREMPVRCSIECTLHCVVRLSGPVPRAITRWATAALRPPAAAQRKAPRSIEKNPPETRVGFASAALSLIPLLGLSPKKSCFCALSSHRPGVVTRMHPPRLVMSRKQRVLTSDDLRMRDNSLCYIRLNANAAGNPKIGSTVAVGLYHSSIGLAHRVHGIVKFLVATLEEHHTPFRRIFWICRAGSGSRLSP